MEYETFETLLDKVTDPTNSNIDWEKTNSFCDLVNKDLDGPSIGTRYIIRKLQTDEEKIQVLTLCVLDACVRHCGRRFHAEIGKYKFLNELIKLLSPKYRGGKTSITVKRKIADLMDKWNVGLPSEAKIGEAYRMLKDQGLTTFSDDQPQDLSPKAETQELFDEEKSKLLARLLKSTHPEDLQAANRLIKNMVRQDEMRMERLQKRMQELETCGNNVKLLTEMLLQFNSATAQDKDLMKELYLSCDKMRPQLFRLASQATEDGDECLAEILKANDDLSKVLDEYRKKMGISSPSQPDGSETIPQASSLHPITSPAPTTGEASVSLNESSLIDLGAMSPAKTGGASSEGTAGGSILEDQLKALGLNSPAGPTQVPWGTPAPAPAVTQSPWGVSTAASPFMGGAPTTGFANFGGTNLTSTSNAFGGTGQRPNLPASTTPAIMSPSNSILPGNAPLVRGLLSGTSSVVNRVPDNQDEKKKKVNPLDLLGQEMLNKEKEKQQAKPKQDSLLDLGKNLNEQLKVTENRDLSFLHTNNQKPVTQASQIPASSLKPAVTIPPLLPPAPLAAATVPLSLDEVFVPLEKIQPGTLPPLNAYDKNGIKTVFHFAKDTSQSTRPDVLVIVVSTMSTASSPVTNFVFQAAVPKTMKVKLQPPSSTELPAHNPILPPSAITQVMLIANPVKEKIRLRHRISYEVNGSTIVESADIEDFPVQ